MTALIEELTASPVLTQVVHDQLHHLFRGLLWIGSSLGHSHVVCLVNENMLATDTQPMGMAELRCRRSRFWCDGEGVAWAGSPPSAQKQRSVGEV